MDARLFSAIEPKTITAMGGAMIRRRLAVAALVAASALLGATTTHAATPASGWLVTDFVTGLSDGCCFGPSPNPSFQSLGPEGIAFDGSGNVFVADFVDGFIYRFPTSAPAGGWTATVAARINPSTPLNNPAGLAFGKDGHLYVVSNGDGTVLDIDPVTGQILRTVASGIPCPVGLATDPLSGDLFVTTTCLLVDPITRIHLGPTPTQSAYSQAELSMDGITIALNGTMYVGANDGSVYSVDGTDSPTAGTVHLLTSVTDGDGVGVAANPGDPSQPPFIAVNSNDGFMNEVALPSLAQSTIFSGGTRGDLVGVGPDGCLYATQSASIVRVEEADGTCPFQPTTVNTAPQVSISSPTFDQLIQVGTSGGTATVAVTAPLTDANTQGSHSCTIQWDAPLTPVAGTVTETVGSGSGTCSGSNNLYPGVYLIMVKVQNNRDALTGTASTEIVVYDPSAGFVTGGGWINSPSGAMPANPGPTGTANFGFVSAYKKGATVPTGETEFQFQVGNLDFHSNTYTVLVVSGNQAQYRGSGTINGANDSSGNPYHFILTAKDGDMNGGTNPDGFRMKITNSSGTVIYDNLVGATDDLGNTQILAGGDIKIHS